MTQKVFHRLVYLYEKKTFALSDAIISVSDFTKNQVKAIFGYDSTRIYNGIDEKLFYPKKTDIDIPARYKNKTIIFFAGNMTKRKGVDLFPEIMEKLGDKFVLLCASGIRKNIVKNMQNIKIIGSLSQEELIDYYNLCDIFLFPTRMEGFSLTALEAMACAKPIVTHNCSSLPEVIIDKKGGFLCEVDNVDEIVEKIRILAADSSLRKEMGRFNRERIEKHFTLKQMAENYLNLYREVLRKRK
jgi:glycosyltransferase involved in cell wall biosynthesis